MLTLITKIKKQLLWLWVGFSIPVLLLVFIQTIAGKYAEIETTPWMWTGVNLLPGFILLMYGAVRNKNAGKFIQTFIYRIIFVAVVAYLILILMTLIAMTAGSAEQSLVDYFQQSYQWLLPFQVLLLGVFGLLYFREEPMFLPNEKIIKEHVIKEMKKVDVKNNQLKQEGFELLQANNYSELFELLQQQKGTVDEDEETKLLMLKTQYNKWENDTSLGLLDQKKC